MFRSKTLKPAVAGVALAFILASPALAQGKADRARAAIAAAEAKIQAGDTAGVGAALPNRQAEARASLNTAKEDLAAGRKEEAIARANQASTIAEAAIGEAQQRKSAEAASAQQQANDANTKVQQAQTDAALAQQQAADASARAANAEQSAAVSARRADAAIAVAATNAATPQVETTVTTSETRPRAAAKPRKVVKTVVRKAAPASATVAETSTTVTTRQP